MTKNVLRAVHDDDLEAYLGNLGLLASIRAGKLSCKFCDETISLEALHAVFPESGMIHVVCSKPDCIKALMRYLNER